MAKFEYSTSVGGYGEDVRISIEIAINSAVDKEDYSMLKTAAETIEEIGREYQPKPEKKAS